MSEVRKGTATEGGTAPYREAPSIPVVPIVAPTSPPKSRLTGTQIIAFVCVLFFTASVVFMAVPVHRIARVQSQRWDRFETLLEQHDYTHTGWKNEAGDRDVFDWGQCASRHYSDRNCHPHDCYCHSVAYSCRCSSSRGHRSCSTCYHHSCSTCWDRCAVYEDWCENYRFHQWDTMNQLQSSGVDHNPIWPGLAAVGERQRVDRRELYVTHLVDVSDPNRTWDKEMSLSEFLRYNTGERWRVEWMRIGVLSIHSRVR